MRLLGELYNFRLVDSSVVFDTLYLLLAFGHEDASSAAKLDPATNYFRIRLVCALLETCGTYFSRGGARRRLDRYLLYFQRYVLSKPSLPLDFEFDVEVRDAVVGCCRGLPRNFEGLWCHRRTSATTCAHGRR
jgi:regulator of nonsense transcripts 2